MFPGAQLRACDVPDRLILFPLHFLYQDRWMYCSCVESSGWNSFETNIKKEKENSRVWKNVYEVWVSVVVSTFTCPTPFLKLSHNVCSLNLEFAEFRHAFNRKRIFKNDSASVQISGLLGLKKPQTKREQKYHYRSMLKISLYIILFLHQS